MRGSNGWRQAGLCVATGHMAAVNSNKLSVVVCNALWLVSLSQLSDMTIKPVPRIPNHANRSINAVA